MTGRNPKVQAAQIVGWHVGRKVDALQTALCGDGRRSAAARAKLAELRRLNAAAASSWLTVGDVVFGGWPHERFAQVCPYEQDEERAVVAVRAALGLFALHQQSSSTGRALVRGKDEDLASFERRRSSGSFGRACRLIELDLDEAAGVMRHLASIESATNFEVVLHHMRALIRLMRSCETSESIRLDYDRLAQDLFLIQCPGALHDGVLRRWSHAYFVRDANPEDEAQIQE